MSAIALIAVGLEASPGTPASPTSSVSRSSQATTFPWKGNDASCEVRLPTLGSSVSYGRFTTCPPKRVLILGDSVALTMGTQLYLDEDDWGTVVDDAGLNGCGFVTGYNVVLRNPYVPNSRFTPLDPHCNNEIPIWQSDIRSFGPEAIVVEMGWWDSYRHVINHKVARLTQPQYDSLVERRILGLIHSIRIASAAPIYFLSVPWMQPASLPNGQPEPAASTASHNQINSLIQSATQSSPKTRFVDISPYITPTGQFQANVDGGVCRTSDGIHLYSNYVHTGCGRALQRGLLSMIRQDLTKRISAPTAHQ